MATAFRQHASSKGADPRTQTIVATGGAGPAHAYRVAEKIGISEIICPHGAGVASSIGLMKAPRSYETASTSRGTLNSLDSDDFEAEFSALYEEAREVLVQAGCDEENLISRLSLDMRHVDQGQEIKVELPDVILDTVTPSLAREHFEATYRDRFDRDSLDHPIEVMTYRVDLREPESRTSFSRQSADTVNESTNDRDIYVGETGTIGATVHQWDALDPGTAVSGPAVIEAAHTTAVVGPEWTATVEENMNITMTPGGRIMNRDAKPTELDTQVLWNRLQATAEEMWDTAGRLAFSISIRDWNDTATAVMTPAGDAIGLSGRSVPVLSGAISRTTRLILKDYFPPETFEPGDVVITNDPWIGGGHLSDVVLLKPVFVDDQLVAFAGALGHVGDIGGLMGGWGTDAQQYYEEGLAIPPLKFYRCWRNQRDRRGIHQR